MSLINDTDFLIHSLRLAYLRHVEDPFGPRIVSLSPGYSTNPYIRAAGLANQDRWPELAVPASPQPSSLDDAPSPSPLHSLSQQDLPQAARTRTGNANGNQPSSLNPEPAPAAGEWPGATGLKYTQTIMGPNRSGALGMRVSGRRASSSNRRDSASILTGTTAVDGEVGAKPHRIRADSAPTPVSAGASPTPHHSVLPDVGDGATSERRRASTFGSGGGTVRPSILSPDVEPSPKSNFDLDKPLPVAPSSSNLGTTATAATPDKEKPAAPVVQFAPPRFPRAAEMEARRRVRMNARAPPPEPAENNSNAAQHHGYTGGFPRPSDFEEGGSMQHAFSGASAAGSTSGMETNTSDDDEADDDEDDDVEDEDDEDYVLTLDQPGEAGDIDIHEDEFDGADFLLHPRYSSRPHITSHGSSDILSGLSVNSASGLSTSHSSSALQIAMNTRNRSRLSPVSEVRRPSISPVEMSALGLGLGASSGFTPGFGLAPPAYGSGSGISPGSSITSDDTARKSSREEVGSYLMVPTNPLGGPFDVSSAGSGPNGGSTSSGSRGNGGDDERLTNPSGSSVLSDTTMLTATTSTATIIPSTATAAAPGGSGSIRPQAHPQEKHKHPHSTAAGPSASHTHTHSHSHPHPHPHLRNKPSEPSFARIKITRLPTESALTALLASQSTTSDNPFTTLYAAISGRAETASMTLRVYFPHSRTHASEPLELKVRKDATVEEVIGFGLWAYWDEGCEPRLDEGCEPRLDEGLEGDAAGMEERRAVRLSAVGWCLRLVEDNGEVDEDFPALDRTSAISKFAFGEFAIEEATPSQVQQNQAVEAKIVRRPSRLMMSKQRSQSNLKANSSAASNLGTGAQAGAQAVPGSSAVTGTLLNSSMLSSNTLAGATVAAGPPVFLKVRVAETADAQYFSTTINVNSDTYMADVLELVCRKRRIMNAKEWALLLGDMSILIPLDRTVVSLRGKKELVLYKRAWLGQLAYGLGRQPGRSADPNASIFDSSDAPAGTTDPTAAYKRYTVLRKLPMLVGRHERILAIDGDYIHIMPSTTRRFLDNVNTASYHIKSIYSCAQSKKIATYVKLVVKRDTGNKRYDFEAENVEQAAEIVASIKRLQKAYSLERSTTVNKKHRRHRTNG